MESSSPNNSPSCKNNTAEFPKFSDLIVNNHLVVTNLFVWVSFKFISTQFLKISVEKE